MSGYNTLTTEIMCKSCTVVYSAWIQFDFGSIWEDDYIIGDKIKWRGGHDDRGAPNLAHTTVHGTLENETCTTCGYRNSEGFDIYISHDVIIEVHPVSIDTNPDDENYWILLE